MVVIEEIAVDGINLEDSPEEDEDDIACELEDNVVTATAAPTGDAPDHPVLEENEGEDVDEDDGDDEWEIPFAEKEEGPETHAVFEVRLHREGNERLGLVLDEQNCVVMLREGTPAARSGEIEIGDQIMELQGVQVTPQRRVAVLLRELPDAAVYSLKIKRELSGKEMTEHLEHGPLMTKEELEQFQERQEDLKHELRKVRSHHCRSSGRDAGGGCGVSVVWTW